MPNDNYLTPRVTYQAASPDSPYAICYQDLYGNTLFTIGWDGTVTLHAMTDLDAASRQFWQLVAQSNPLQAECDRLRARIAELEQKRLFTDWG